MAVWKQRIHKWAKKMAEEYRHQWPTDELPAFSPIALLYAKQHEIPFWEYAALEGDGVIGLSHMKEARKSLTCDVCAYQEPYNAAPRGMAVVIGCVGSCGRKICDDCRVVDEDDPVCQACYDSREAEECDEDETCSRCAKTFRYYLHDYTCDDCSSYFVCKSCEKLMDGCGICGK